MSESYRQTRNYENLNRCIFPGVGEFGIPELEPVHCDAETWIGFNYAKGCDVEDRPAHSVHFFIDDYQFNRLWTAPDALKWRSNVCPVPAFQHELKKRIAAKQKAAKEKV